MLFLRPHPFDRQSTAIPPTRPTAPKPPRARAVKGGASHRRGSADLPLTGVSTAAPLPQDRPDSTIASMSNVEELIVKPWLG